MTEPVAEGTSASGSVAFDRAAGYYDATRGLPPDVSEQVADRMEAVAGPDARFLEIGVGTGRIALPLHRRGRRVTGVDLSVPMMAEYRRKAAAAGLAAPPLVRADVTRLPFRDASADVVVEVHVLHLVPAWREALPELRRVLAPGGLVLVGRGGGHGEDPRSPRDLVSRRMRELVGDRPHVGARDDEEKLEALAAVGGAVEQLEPVRWDCEETWADALAEIEGRCYSYSWGVPEPAWAAAARRLRAEVEAEHPDLHAPVGVPSVFRLAAVRF
ncbi:MAG TPA: class I SAM-dependent methyltransferase [Actinomycetes bacterium]|nr:class I SAM-dependent methyltransferase [Actinomycetes bacterium]